MPNSSRRRLRPVPRRKRFLRAVLYATVIASGLALGAALVVVAVPRRKSVAQAIPVATPRPSPLALPQPTVPTPSSTPTPAPAVPLAPVVEARLVASPETPPAAPVKVNEIVAAVAVVPAKPVPELVVKRMHQRTRADVLAQVAKVPPVSLDRTTKRLESFEMVKATRQAPATPGVASDPSLVLLDRRADLAGLPFRRGSTCRLAKPAALELAQGADAVKFLDDERLATTLSGQEEWLRAERVPALMQVVMAQSEKKRRALARHLAGVEGGQASEALARIAMFDPEPEVRREAVASLAKRRAGEYRRPLIRGFESPWPVVAEHAAEALAALKRTEAAPALLAILDGPDPQAPYTKAGGLAYFVKEVVRVNHRINCLMCHPPSFRETDPARGPVPPLRESFQSFGYSGTPRKNETFVRADVTYLKQDYSVILEKTEPGVLTGKQRYDLFVRERFATSADVASALVRKNAGPTGQQLAAAFALRELTGQEPGAGFVNWIRFARSEKRLARQ